MKRLILSVLLCVAFSGLAATHKNSEKGSPKPKEPAVTTVTTTVPAEVPPADALPSAHPSLISSVDVQTADSPLVRAAKLAVAKRQGSTAPVITANVVQHATGANVSEPNKPFPYPVQLKIHVPKPKSADQPAVEAAPPPPPPQPEAQQPNRADLEKQIAALKREQERLASEAEQPYGGEVPGDQIEKRMTEIKRNLATLNHTLANTKP